MERNLALLFLLPIFHAAIAAPLPIEKISERKPEHIVQIGEDLLTRVKRQFGFDGPFGGPFGEPFGGPFRGPFRGPFGGPFGRPYGFGGPFGFRRSYFYDRPFGYGRGYGCRRCCRGCGKK
ncbi:sulfur globule protein CV1 domain protein [Necator americanus]|uniref:Sulfur globule protein CV1 domain protein n=1 Tax=Necator americanus TaxID=51031 RepID=W2SUG2_NECAM|nr:sulfur globule protein CV1 domain protein [Necator americanus]ETN72481.1 sulfur globule protein CV1 domain protein [Necator americanus]